MTTLNNTGGVYNGICTLFYNDYDGDPISDYHDLVVSTPDQEVLNLWDRHWSSIFCIRYK